MTDALSSGGERWLGVLGGACYKSGVEYMAAELLSNTSCGGDSFLFTLGGCQALAGARPGQFAMLRGDWGLDPLLPRAFSILESKANGEATFLGKAMGKGTRLLHDAQPGSRFTVLGPLGNSFLAPTAERPQWLVAGGVGLAPLLFQARRAVEIGGTDVRLYYGARTRADLVLLDQIQALGIPAIFATEDGSMGVHGYVTEALLGDLRTSGLDPMVLACGPEPMLVAVAKIGRGHNLKTFLSLEGEMACGFGVCLGCAVPCASKPYRYTCVDGPVMDLQDLRGRFA